MVKSLQVKHNNGEVVLLMDLHNTITKENKDHTEKHKRKDPKGKR